MCSCPRDRLCDECRAEAIALLHGVCCSRADQWLLELPKSVRVMLSQVRGAIGKLLDLPVQYVDPDSILARYAELMAENARREAEKAAQAERKAKRTKRPS